MSLTDENIQGASDSSLPSFVTGSNNTLVTSVGQTIYLYCGVNNLGDRQVCKLSISYCRQQGESLFVFGGICHQIVKTHPFKASVSLSYFAFVPQVNLVILIIHPCGKEMILKVDSNLDIINIDPFM